MIALYLAEERTKIDENETIWVVKNIAWQDILVLTSQPDKEL